MQQDVRGPPLATDCAAAVANFDRAVEHSLKFQIAAALAAAQAGAAVATERGRRHAAAFAGWAEGALDRSFCDLAGDPRRRPDRPLARGPG
jgi:hypothetical protein